MNRRNLVLSVNGKECKRIKFGANKVIDVTTSESEGFEGLLNIGPMHITTSPDVSAQVSDGDELTFDDQKLEVLKVEGKKIYFDRIS